MQPTRGRPAAFQRRVLGELYRHHQAVGWDAPLPRGELLARLQGLAYGRQVADRGGDLVVYTGVAPAAAGSPAYQAANKHLTRALVALYGRGLVRLGNHRQPRLEGAADVIAEMAADLDAPEAAYARYLAAGLRGTYEEFLVRRRAALAAWRAGRGRPHFVVQLVALTAEGRAVAARDAGNNGDFFEAARSHQKSEAR